MHFEQAKKAVFFPRLAGATVARAAVIALTIGAALASLCTEADGFVVRRSGYIHRGGYGGGGYAYHRGVTRVGPYGGVYHRGVTRVGTYGGFYHRGVTAVGVRTWGVRPWVARPYFGAVVAGVTLGAVVAATAYNVAPAPPAANVCWYWTDNARVQGYWSYCQ